MRRKQNIHFEWNVGDDELGALFLPNRLAQVETSLALPAAHPRWRSSQAWQSAPPSEPGPLLSAGEVQFLWHRLRDLFLLALALICLGSMPFTPRQLAQQRAEAGITTALATEYTAWQQKDREQFAALLDLPAVERWQWEWRDYWSLTPTEFTDLGITLRRVDQQGEIVRVEGLVTRPSTKWWRSSPYRETRFYRESAQGWLRTLPPESYWGARQTIETQHLRFEFTTYDAPAIQPQVAQLQMRYLELYNLLALDPATRYKWTFVLVPERTDGRTSDYYRYEYTSPALSEVPDTLSNQEYVAQMIVSTMASQAVYGSTSLTRRHYLHRWEMLVWSLYGWLRSDLLDQRSPWHTQAQTVFQESLANQVPLQLNDIEYWPDDGRPAQERVMRQYMVSESIIDFAITTYGRDKLSLLLAGLERYRDWDSLTRAIFDVSAVDFEAAWNHYLVQTYLDQPQ